MKKILLTISVCSFDGYYVGSLKVATVISLVPVIMKNLEEAGIVVRGYETSYLDTPAVNPLCQATMIVAEVLQNETEITDYAKRTPDVSSIPASSSTQN